MENHLELYFGTNVRNYSENVSTVFLDILLLSKNLPGSCRSPEGVSHTALRAQHKNSLALFKQSQNVELRCFSNVPGSHPKVILCILPMAEIILNSNQANKGRSL